MRKPVPVIVFAIGIEPILDLRRKFQPSGLRLGEHYAIQDTMTGVESEIHPDMKQLLVVASLVFAEDSIQNFVRKMKRKNPALTTIAFSKFSGRLGDIDLYVKDSGKDNSCHELFDKIRRFLGLVGPT